MATPWTIKGAWVEACNCDYGCPCNFSGFPTKGFCQGIVAFKVESGRLGDVPLDGVVVIGAVSWPGAIHEGNGTMAVFVAERANDAQRDAIIRILTGQESGMPFEILAQTVSDVKGPFFAPVTFEDRGTKTKLSAPGIDVELDAFTNPVTGEEHEVHTVIPGRFIWRDGQVCRSGRNLAKVDGIEWDLSGQSAYYAKVEWSNAEAPGKVAGTKF